MWSLYELLPFALTLGQYPIPSNSRQHHREDSARKCEWIKAHSPQLLERNESNVNSTTHGQIVKWFKKNKFYYILSLFKIIF